MRILTRLLLILIVAVTMSASTCKKKVNVDPTNGGTISQPAPKPKIDGDAVLAASKRFGKVLAIAIDKGIRLEATLASNGTIDKQVEPKIRQGLLDAQAAVKTFNEHAAGWQHFDASSRADIEKLLQDTINYISDLNDNGILHIKNPNSQIVASGILLGASAAVDAFKLLFDEVQQ